MNAKIHSESEMDEYEPHGSISHALSKRFTDAGMIEESREIQRMQHLALDRVSNIQFCIDGAVGLPLSTTATRVTARLLDHERRQIGEPSASTVSHPDSPVASPIFDLQAGWRGSICFYYSLALLNLIATSFYFEMYNREHAFANHHHRMSYRHA